MSRLDLYTRRPDLPKVLSPSAAIYSQANVLRFDRILDTGLEDVWGNCGMERNRLLDSHGLRQASVWALLATIQRPFESRECREALLALERICLLEPTATEDGKTFAA